MKKNSLVLINAYVNSCNVGGGYGLARVTLGFYAGFMVGCCEIMEYIIYTADTCLSLNDLIVQATHLDKKFSPIIWLIFYVSAVTVHCVGGKVFWRVSNILAFLSITIIVIYCLGSLKFVDFRYAREVAYMSPNIDVTNSSLAFTGIDSGIDSPPTEIMGPVWFIGGGFEFMRVLPLAGWMYVGIETLNFASNDIAEVRQSI
jgi:ethanolamine permease